MVRRLSKQEIKEICLTTMQEDFPEAERKPWEWIENLIEADIYFVYGMYEKDELLAYGFFVGNPGKGPLLLDYYAVAKAKRGEGVGSYFLKLLQKELSGNKGILIEVENPEFAQSKEQHRAQIQRIEFYRKNGALSTQIRSCLFQVEYHILYLPLTENKRDRLSEQLDEIYCKMFPQRLHGREVVIYE